MKQARSRGKSWSLAQAGFVVGASAPEVKRAIHKGPVEVDYVLYQGRRQASLDYHALVYLVAMKELQPVLAPAARTKFYEAIRKRRNQLTHGVDLAPNFHIDIKPWALFVDHRLQALEQLEEFTERGPEDQVWISGTRTEVHRIAALLDGGASVEEVISAYPSLSRDQVLGAQAWATAHPKRGRPFPKAAAKAAMAGADLDGLDDFLPERR